MGRQGLELEEEQRLMIESGEVGEAEPEEQQQDGGIFSSSTLAALQNAKFVPAPKPKPTSSGPLVAYDSDSD